MTTIEAISSFKGKVITNVTANPDKYNRINSFTVYFEDGSEFEVYSLIVAHGNEEWPAISEIVVDKT
jgi:hypothetical protein